jgi:hypothetical protein
MQARRQTPAPDYASTSEDSCKLFVIASSPFLVWSCPNVSSCASVTSEDNSLGYLRIILLKQS